MTNHPMPHRYTLTYLDTVELYLSIPHYSKQTGAVYVGNSAAFFTTTRKEAAQAIMRYRRNMVVEPHRFAIARDTK